MKGRFLFVRNDAVRSTAKQPFLSMTSVLYSNCHGQYLYTPYLVDTRNDLTDDWA
jgi:hypothetical protein